MAYPPRSLHTSRVDPFQRLSTHVLARGPASYRAGLAIGNRKVVQNCSAGNDYGRRFSLQLKQKASERDLHPVLYHQPFRHSFGEDASAARIVSRIFATPSATESASLRILGGR